MLRKPEAILSNQARILANQKKLLANQQKLGALLAGQKAIKANQTEDPGESGENPLQALNGQVASRLSDRSHTSSLARSTSSAAP